MAWLVPGPKWLLKWGKLGRVNCLSNNVGGDTIDCYFASKRDKKAALAFFKKAIGAAGLPVVVNIDKSGSNTAALIEINKTLSESEQLKIRQNKYLNNMIEQDHRFVELPRKTEPRFAQHIARIYCLGDIIFKPLCGACSL